MSSPICVDASFVLKLFLDEPGSEQVAEMWAQWIAEDRQTLAPSHLTFEVTSVVRNHVFRGNISLEAGLAALEAFQAQEIDLLPPATLVQRAWELAEQFDRPTAYDSFYLAAAEHTGSEMWTADRRLFAAVHDQLPWVNMLNY